MLIEVRKIIIVKDSEFANIFDLCSRQWGRFPIVAKVGLNRATRELAPLQLFIDKIWQRFKHKRPEPLVTFFSLRLKSQPIIDSFFREIPPSIAQS
jgi:hypothetical protein